jgi:hypothetical protein
MMDLLKKVLLPLSFLVVVCILAWPANSQTGLVPRAQGLPQIQGHLDALTSRVKEVQKLYGCCGMSVEGWGLIEQALKAAGRRHGVSEETINNLARSWAGWFASTYGDGSKILYAYHETALRDSIANIKDREYIVEIDLRYLESAMQRWLQYETRFRSLVEQHIDLSAQSMLINQQSSELAAQKCADSVCEAAKSKKRSDLQKETDGISAQDGPIQTEIAHPPQFFISINGLGTYIIGKLDVVEHDAKKALLSSEIDSAEHLIDTRTEELQAANKALIGPRDAAYFKATAEGKIQNELADLLVQLEAAQKKSDSESVIKELRKKAEELRTKLVLAHTSAQFASEEATKKAQQVANAKRNITDAKAQLLRLLDEKRKAALQRAIHKIVVKANGVEVFAAEYSEEDARKLEEYFEFKARVSKDLAEAKQRRDTAEATLIDLQKAAQKELDDLVSSIKTLGGVKATIIAIKGGAAAAKGGFETGVPGALYEVAKFAVQQLLEQKLQHERDLATEIERALDKETQASSSDLPLGRIALQVAGTTGVWGVGITGIELSVKSTELLKEEIKPLLEKFISDTKTPASLLPAMKKLDEARRLAKAVEGCGNVGQAAAETVAQPQMRAEFIKKVKEGGVGVAADWATDVALKSIEQFFESEEGAAWAQYFIADRAEAFQRVAYSQASGEYRALQELYDEIVWTGVGLLRVKLGGGIFDKRQSSAFVEGAVIELSTMPSVDKLGDRSFHAELGDTTLNLLSGNKFTGEAKGLGHVVGTIPREVTVKLEVY